MAEGDDKTAWVRRVLGFEFPGQSATPIAAAAASAAAASAAAPEDDLDPIGIWREAKEATDQKMNALAGKLRETGDVDLIRIADFGLFGISAAGGVNVALNKALLEFRAASGERRPAVAQQVRQAVSTYRANIIGNQAVKLVDDNPFGVDVALAATLGAALDRIERSLP